MTELFTKVSGTAEGGWIVEIHDGVRFGTYSPSAATADEALAKGREIHANPTVADQLQPVADETAALIPEIVPIAEPAQPDPAIPPEAA
jgi:hypothetical protein